MRLCGATTQEETADAAVKLRRLSVYLEAREPVRLLEGALEAVKRAAERLGA